MKTFDYTTRSKKVLGDLHTPVSIYLKVRDIYPQSALMESSDYSCRRKQPFVYSSLSVGEYRGKQRSLYNVISDGCREKRMIDESFTVEKAINDFISRFRVSGDESRVCGLYGYTTFNAVKYFENIPVKESHDECNDAPDMLYILYKQVIVFNHFKNELTLVEMLSEGEGTTLNELESVIENRNFASYNFFLTAPVYSTVTDEQHKANVRKGIEHCLRGDVFQIVLSVVLSSLFRVMTLRCIERCVLSIRLLICFISISEGIVYSDLHPKRIAG